MKAYIHPEGIKPGSFQELVLHAHDMGITINAHEKNQTFSLKAVAEKEYEEINKSFKTLQEDDNACYGPLTLTRQGQPCWMKSRNKIYTLLSKSINCTITKYADLILQVAHMPLRKYVCSLTKVQPQ